MKKSIYLWDGGPLGGWVMFRLPWVFTQFILKLNPFKHKLMLLTKKELMEREDQNLAAYAFKSSVSMGREKKEEDEGKYRTCFQRDRDRIIHSKSFRRLKSKTQVFVAYQGDHYRNRLSHTLEVTQISRDIARGLNLNEDLAEAIALAHDLGHAPFGHAGEEILNKIMEGLGSKFEHNNQSKRVVTKLEKMYPGFEGLNLTKEVLEGLIKHQTFWDNPSESFIPVNPTLEAQVVNLSDEIAYSNHDLDDGLRSGLLKWEEVEKLRIWKLAEKKALKKYGKDFVPRVLPYRVISSMIGLMIEDVFLKTTKNLTEEGIKTIVDVYLCRSKLVDFSFEMQSMIKELRTFLYQNFYFHPEVQKKSGEGQNIIKRLFKFYYQNPINLPKEEKLKLDKEPKTEVIKDYIAGMTDRFAEELVKKL